VNPDKLFKLYRSNLEKLDLGVYLNASLNSSRDLALHTCDQLVYPSKLEKFESFSMYSDYKFNWKPKYDEDFSRLVLTKNFDYKKLDILLKKYKGLWHISPSLWKNDQDKIKSFEVGDFNFLEFFNPGVSKLIHKYVRKIGSNFKRLEVESYIFPSSFNPDPDIRATLFAYEGFRRFLKNYWKCDHFKEKKCALCGSVFFPQSNADWVGYARPDYCGYCLQLSFHSGHGCWEEGNEKSNYQTLGLKENEIKDNFIASLKGFVDYAGFIPTSRFTARKLRTMGLEDMSVNDSNLFMKWWAVLPRPFFVKAHFKSWSHLLNDADLLTAPISKGKGGYKSIASDGHLCLSIPERTICEFLTKFKIDHEKEPNYPKIMDNHLGDSRADWLIQDTYVEFAGMMGVKEYELKMKKKVTFAKANGLKLIVITPKDVDNLEKIFSEFVKS
jgi:hypothetical protein